MFPVERFPLLTVALHLSSAVDASKTPWRVTCRRCHIADPVLNTTEGKLRFSLQSRRLDVRLRMPKTPEGESQKEYVHMLNGTLTATERTICCLLENHQTPEGVK